MTFKEKERLVRYIFNKRKQILMYEQYVCDKNKEESAEDMFLRWVHYALNNCSKVSRLILENSGVLKYGVCCDPTFKTKSLLITGPNAKFNIETPYSTT